MSEKTKERSREEPYLQIGEVAERTGVTQRTLRFYEERGLLAVPSRMEGGFRLYSEEDVTRVEQIRKLQNLLNLSLAEIKDMVDAEEVKTELRATYRPDLDLQERLARVQKAIGVTQRQHKIITDKVEALLVMKKDLEEKLERYRTWQVDLTKQIEGGAPG